MNLEQSVKKLARAVVLVGGIILTIYTAPILLHYSPASSYAPLAYVVGGTAASTYVATKI